MNHRAQVGRTRRAISAALAITSTCLLALTAASLMSSPAPAATVLSPPAFTQTKTIQRDHLVNGADDVVDSRTVTVTADTTTSLRERQTVHIAWSGAHPTGGVIYDSNSQYAPNQEYPVAILQCRGVDSTSVPTPQQLSPETCYTQTPEQRYQPPYQGSFPPYRVDRYASSADRALTVGAPAVRPDSCQPPDGFDAERWVPFVALDGTLYHGGSLDCGGLSPEQSKLQNALIPPSTTWAASDRSGNGSAKFTVQSVVSNASLGCSDTIACSIVVIPIMGISCDATGQLALPADKPTDPAATFASCSQAGHYAPGEQGDQGASSADIAQRAVTGQLWWSASNWRNRISIPIAFAQTTNVCDILGNGASSAVYGAESMFQATQQWAPKFCLDPKGFPLKHLQLSSVQAKNQLRDGLFGNSYSNGTKAAFQEEPPSPGFFSNPVVQAPTAVSGFAISFLMDDAKGHEYKSLKLDARLLAKLITMSYPAYTDIKSGYSALSGNPLDMGVDPEFLALNPGMNSFPNGGNFNQLEASATLFMMSSSSDVMAALTSYINSDPDARSWLNGTPDPWGMVVNPSYLNILLPTDTWPQLDNYQYSTDPNCPKIAILPAIAAPVSDPTLIARNMQFGITNSQVRCSQPDGINYFTLGAVGRQNTGIRFLLGLVSLADAERYGLNEAELETQKSSAAADLFTDPSGRSFVGPTNDSLKAAAAMLVPDSTLGTWTLPYDSLRTDPAGAAAYPGTFLISTDVPTKFLTPTDAANYSQFLTFAAGVGQTPGLQNGQLPPGYLPMTSANGLGQLVAYTNLAAAAVAAQTGEVPPLIPVPPASPAASTSPTSSPGTVGFPSHTPLPGGSTYPADTSPALSSATQSPTNTPSRPTSNPPLQSPARSAAVTSSTHSTPKSAVSASPSASTSVATVLMGKTINRSTGPLGLALPALLLLAVLSGLGSAWISGVGRR